MTKTDSTYYLKMSKITTERGSFNSQWIVSTLVVLLTLRHGKLNAHIYEVYIKNESNNLIQF